MVLNDVPNGAIECCDTKDIPLVRDPTPQGSVAIHSNAVFVGDEDICECRDKWNAVAEQEIPNFHAPQAHGVKLEIER